MKSLAVLITCHNRKEKTLQCLRNLYKAYEINNGGFIISLYLTDDGCTDGTIEAILDEFLDRDITVLKGSGSLYWAGGMRRSWNEALKYKFEGYLMLNDDTLVFENVFEQIFEANLYSYNKYGKGGIYVGSTTNSEETSLTYGGSVFINKFLNTTVWLQPTDSYQECHLGNANITYVSKDVVDKIGILHKSYIHSIADYDYTYNAYVNKMPLFILKGFQGICEDDHQEDGYFKFNSLTLKERIKFLYGPLGLEFKESLLFQKRFFPYRYPIVFITAWFKVLFPKSYYKLNSLRN
ncbi:MULTISPECIES: glycosyltransferase family 2 protein [unclassified Polaribacter]|uniref:glycosyltransferase family 2 protein n=1 Tax=unclassified Polaribacter TaxID=196858 RepID=UPI0011BFC66B|nr:MULTISPECIES: glycosyltransferase family 2 protein [unclassified Polaribacter]TXD50336.1 glycosyltransferase family 2 protein [Polaribacter sp. IC063]TXD57181.1 glycosyltransferase family 2 protein [Polaribacter sp. IC066]